MVRLLSSIALILLLASRASAIDVTFVKKCEVKGPLVRLGDVAQIDTFTELGKSLASIAVGNSPAPGEKSYFRTKNIKKYLLASQTLPEDIEWKGSPSIAVKRSGLALSSRDILDYISNYIRSQENNLPQAVIRFIPSALPLPFTLPTGNLHCQVIPSNPNILGSNRFSLIFTVDDRVVKNMSVRGKLEARANIITASIGLRRGTILQQHHLKNAVVDISNIKNPGFFPEDFIGKKLKRTLRGGTPIEHSMVEALPVVHRGEKVKIVVQSGPMMLTATGLAHTDGKMNELIRVQNLKSQKIIFARVAAPGIVEVIL